jgi:hypothetical protein
MFPLLSFDRRTAQHARRGAPATPRCIVGDSLVARRLGQFKEWRGDVAAPSATTQPSRPTAFRCGGSFKPLAASLRPFPQRPVKSVLLRLLCDVVEQYSLHFHNITKTSAIFLAKNDVNKESLTIKLTCRAAIFAIYFIYTSTNLLLYFKNLPPISQLLVESGNHQRT